MFHRHFKNISLLELGILRCLKNDKSSVKSAFWVMSWHALLSSANFFQNKLFKKEIFRNTIGVSNRLDPDQALRPTEHENYHAASESY